ncbi:uncharacterized protein LOC110249187 [Exaiptasia diaphana]|uniref:Uncharacterized protein n=1 Tax=Exaiptasia diaphana TaxID=2652724 RepID=A0A913XWJ8_EXADI|nr:uncharacterized protein LOC110249187 [Exaiptasia diaphana]
MKREFESWDPEDFCPGATLWKNQVLQPAQINMYEKTTDTVIIVSSDEEADAHSRGDEAMDELVSSMGGLSSTESTPVKKRAKPSNPHESNPKQRRTAVPKFTLSSDEEPTRNTEVPTLTLSSDEEPTSSSDASTTDEMSDDDIPSFHPRKLTEKDQKQKKIGEDVWENVEEVDVDKLPEGIDGLKVYVINTKANDKKVQNVLKDGRRWKKNCPTSWKGHERVRYADCRGFHKCEVKDCPYRVEYGIFNTQQFKINKSTLF